VFAISARAQEALPDRQGFELNKAQWEAFHKALEATPLSTGTSEKRGPAKVKP
jgi:uncharacterized protein (DUF1778 family)